MKTLDKWLTHGVPLRWAKKYEGDDGSEQTYRIVFRPKPEMLKKANEPLYIVRELRKLGARVTLVGPRTLVPQAFEKLGVQISYQIDDVLPDADVVNLLRIQHERQRKEYFPGIGEYTSLFGLTKARAELLKPDCLVMHPGPINRGVEIDSEVADGSRSVILDQVTNGLAVRMAVLYLCGGISE